MAEGLSDEARDADMVAEGLGAWLANRYSDRPDVHIVNMSQNPNNGFSNDSIFLDLQDGERVERLVVRIPPRSQGMMADFDLARQAATQRVLADMGLPTVRPMAFEGDTSWIGAPFMVMPMMTGRVPPDEPHYSQGGWVSDLPHDQQGALNRNTLAVLADIHRKDWTRASFLARPGGIGLKAEFDWWKAYILWAADGELPEPMARTLRWCEDHMPVIEPAPSILWGDARIGNMIFDAAQNIVAVLDWEVASLGPAEIDLGYFLAFERRNRERLGNGEPRDLPGFLTREEMIAHYEACLGRPVVDIDWFEVFGILRIAGFMLRVQHLIREQGLHDHFVLKRPLIQQWVEDLMAAKEIPSATGKVEPAA